jgi:hypothetical protein
LIARHDALRTTYTTRGGGWVPVVHPAPKIVLQQVDLSRTEVIINCVCKQCITFSLINDDNQDQAVKLIYYSYFPVAARYRLC